MRIEISAKNEYGDPRVHKTAESLSAATGIQIHCVAVVDVYTVSGLPTLSREVVETVLLDPVGQDISIDSSEVATATRKDWNLLVEVTYRPGVTDPEALTAREAFEIALNAPLSSDAVVQAGSQYLLHVPDFVERASVLKALHNDLIEQAYVVTHEDWGAGSRPPAQYDYRIKQSTVTVERIPLAGLTVAELCSLSDRRLLALDAAEMQAVQAYFADARVSKRRGTSGLGTEPTDVELEMIAQTWSEHCKHKIFQARIAYAESDGEPVEEIDGLFGSYIRRLTEEVSAEKLFLRSVFTDNSGVVAFEDDQLLCFKAETHNSPSALDPYGGAITGIVGVNRDIMGTGKGARPIFNTDVLCFGYPDTDHSHLPDGLLHPKTVLNGVHHGIVDGGNQSGIPVVAGGFVFDESYTGKPLVYCGTGGVMPTTINGEAAWVNHVEPGDLAVMVGGRIGKDGIHGATFSSLDLSESSPTSAVQIGDPITQRKMLDFLLEARDRGLYKGITDNGAGGLSSSLGEMAERSGGVRIDLHRCPLKYPGLAPWEILVSESQERMSLAVAPETMTGLQALADERRVEVTVVGEFTNSGHIQVYNHDEIVADVDLDFLHGGVPQMNLSARWIAPEVRFDPQNGEEGGHGEKTTCTTDESREWLQAVESSPEKLRTVVLQLLADPNLRSKEPLVRQYDHEVQAQSVVKPFCGVHSDAPTDGGVLRTDRKRSSGVTVTHGICPRYGDWDTYDMAACAVDEALRAHVALGGDPLRAAALDNFCWPNPIQGADNPDGEYKLAQLVRANKGLFDTCRAYGLPLISGKDSMRNDSTIGGRKLSIRPTLLISLLGYHPDVSKSMTTDFKMPGSIIVLAGATACDLGGSALEHLFRRTSCDQSPWDEDHTVAPFGRCPRVDTAAAWGRYQELHEAISQGVCLSAHDLSDGGLLAALCESAIGGDCGVSINLDPVADTLSPSVRSPQTTALFSESASRFLLEVPAERRNDLFALFDGAILEIGSTHPGDTIDISSRGASILSLSLEDIRRAMSWEGGTE